MNLTTRRIALVSLLLLLATGCERTKDSAEFWILLGGDTSFGENYRDSIKRSGGRSVLDHQDYNRPLSSLRGLMDWADLVLLNLETPLTNRRYSPLEGHKKWIHWGDPRRAPMALKRHNVQAVSLANNHTMDFGIAGLQETLDALKAADIEALGTGDSEDEAARPLMWEVSVGAQQFRFAVFTAFEYRPKYSEVYEFYALGDEGGVNQPRVEALSHEIELLKANDPSIFVLVWPHWGQNYGRRRQQEVENARQLVNAGADLVIGHGAHVLQSIEQYRGRWILYNVGNFMFNSPGRYAKYGVPPFSLAVALVIQAEGGRLRKSLRCYPLFTDNRQTGYRSRLVAGKEFDQVLERLMMVSDEDIGREQTLNTEEDHLGRYFEVLLEH